MDILVNIENKKGVILSSFTSSESQGRFIVPAIDDEVAFLDEKGTEKSGKLLLRKVSYRSNHQKHLHTVITLVIDETENVLDF